MKTALSSAVDPILSQALKLLDQLNEGVDLDPRDVQQQILEQFQQSAALMGGDEGWELAKYALAAWIDEMLVAKPWEGANWWGNNVLEVELFGTRMCSVRFFELSQQALRLQDRDALEVFHNCVVLGFKGLYIDESQAAATANSLGLPHTLDDWLRQTERLIESAGVQRETTRLAAIHGAAPDVGRTDLLWWSVAAIVLCALNLVLYQL